MHDVDQKIGSRSAKPCKDSLGARSSSSDLAVRLLVTPNLISDNDYFTCEKCPPTSSRPVFHSEYNFTARRSFYILYSTEFTGPGTGGRRRPVFQIPVPQLYQVPGTRY
jgi:hypothetical protein